MKTEQSASYNPDAKTKWTTSHRKEGKCFLDVLAVVNLETPAHSPHWANIAAELRLYGTGNTNSACLWVWGVDGPTIRGSGKAGGYGYHRPSAAADEAIRKAGITLALPIEGVGDEAIRGAMEAIARDVCRLEKFVIVRTHA